jgi:hypothetical protein
MPCLPQSTSKKYLKRGMKMQQRLKGFGARPLAAALLAISALSTASLSWANTGATSTVRNIVTVNYANAAGTAQTALTASVDVTVNLVKAAALINAPTNITTDPSTNAVYNYTITNGANGISTYALSTAVGAQTNIAGSTAAPSPISVTLGATTVATAVTIPVGSGATVITVPRDGVADTSINGIKNGATVVISGQLFTVSAVTDVQVPAAPANGPYTTTFTVTPVVAVAVAIPLTAGTLIPEQKTFTVTVTPGTMTSITDATIPVTVTVTDGTNAVTGTTTTTVAAVGLTVSKLVRNVGNAAGNAAGTGSVTYNAVTYYTGGVTGNPGDTLEYLIVVSKGSSASGATKVKVSDPLPPFTTYVASSMAVDTTGVGNAYTALTDAIDADAGETDVTGVIWFYPGSGRGATGGALGSGPGGNMGANATSLLKFQVKIQ